MEPGGFVLVGGNAELRTAVAASAARQRRELAIPRSIDDLGRLLVDRPSAVIFDEQGFDPRALARVNASPARDQLYAIFVTGDLAAAVPPGCDVVVPPRWIRDMLALVQSATNTTRTLLELDRLLGVSILNGPLDHALHTAAIEIAAAFAVDRCVITRSGSADPQPVTQICVDGDRCQSCLALPLDPSQGTGRIALLANGLRLFSRDQYWALRGIATRLNTELAWRAAHDRATQELDRLISAPGLDQLINAWNRAALVQLGGMVASSARRTKQPASVVVLDVVGMQEINTRHGHEVGDRVLQRIAEALRALLREEDVIGRWSGDEIGLFLSGADTEAAMLVIERIGVALAERTVELPDRERLAIPVTFGLATPNPGEAIDSVFARAARNATKAQREGKTVVASRLATSASVPTAPANVSQQLDAIREDLGGMVGGYRLLHEISRGGMGVVYRAEDLALERPVAIKMLRPDLGDDKALFDRLRTEATMLARLQHPNLVQVYSFGQRGGDSYLVMELVEGESLDQAFTRHRAEKTEFSVQDLGRVIEQVAGALDLLHERGIVHRDVKPANIIIDPFRNRAVLVDVGIAAVHGRKAMAAGTPGFIAPEVIVGNEAGPRADVYGLAATAYAMLTLSLPWGDSANMVAVLTRQTSNELRPPSHIRSALAPIDGIVMAALNPDPSMRPVSATAFARELVQKLAGVVDAAGAVSPRRTIPGRPRTTSAERLTRGVVFRSVAPALGVRDAARLRDSLAADEPELSRLLAMGAPLDWLPADLFARLLSQAPQRVGRDPARLARDLARASVRTSFRRFFPTSAATLVPERTLSAIRNVWGRYQSWGTVSSMPLSSTECGVRLTGSLRDELVCEWTCGMLEQLVLLSGAVSPVVEHSACEARGDAECLFQLRWELGAQNTIVSQSSASSSGS